MAVFRNFKMKKQCGFNLLIKSDIDYEQISNREYAKRKIFNILDKYYNKSFCESNKVIFDL